MGVSTLALVLKLLRLRLCFTRREVVLFLVCIHALSSCRKIVWSDIKASSAAFAFQGNRTTMQDRYVLNENINNTGISMFGIFDGHGKSEYAAVFAIEKLVPNLYKKIVDASKILDGIRLAPDQNNNKTHTIKVDVRADCKNEASAEAANEQPSSKKALPKTDMKLTKNEAPKNYLKRKESKFLTKLKKIKNKHKNVSKNVQPKTYEAECYVDKEKKSIDFGRLITDEVLAVDYELVQYLKDNKIESGSTALIAILHGTQLTVANVGDSRGVMCNSNGKAIPLSYDHKPNVPKEKKRIIKNGGFIEGRRVNGWLALSRALGDYRVKDNNVVTAEPDIRTADLSKDRPKFFILASDGLWDKVSNERAVEIAEMHSKDHDYGATFSAMNSYKHGSRDNISVIIVRFEEGIYQLN